MRNCHEFLLSLGFDHNIRELCGLMKPSCSYLLCYKSITVTVIQSFFLFFSFLWGVGGCNSFIYYDCPPAMPMTKKKFNPVKLHKFKVISQVKILENRVN